MARATHIQTSFNGGEFSPKLEGRVDLQRYASSCREMKNFFPTVGGPAEKRPGTHFAGIPRSATSRLIPFQFNVEQAYVIEFTGGVDFSANGWCRFYKNGAVVTENPFTVTAIGIGGVTTFTTSVEHGFWPFAHPNPEDNFDTVFVTGVGGSLGDRINGRTFVVTNTVTANGTSTTFTIPFDSTGLTASAVFGTIARVYELATMFTEDDVAHMTVAQSADVLYIATPNHHPQKLLRFGDADWVMTPSLGYSLDGPRTLSDISVSSTAPVFTTVQAHGCVVGDVVLVSRTQGVKGLNGALVRVSASVTEFSFVASMLGSSSFALDTTIYHRFRDLIGGAPFFGPASTGFISRISSWDFPAFEPENINNGHKVICTHTLKDDPSGSVAILFSNAGIFTADKVGSFIKLRVVPEELYPKWEARTNFNDTVIDDIVGAAGLPLNGYVHFEGNVYQLINKNGESKTGYSPPSHVLEGEQQLDHKFTWQFAHPGYGFAEIVSVDPYGGFFAFCKIRRRLPESVTVKGDTTLFRESCTCNGAAAVVVTVAAGHGFVVGDRVLLSSFTVATRLNGQVAFVGAVGATTITLYRDAGFTLGLAGTNDVVSTGKVVRWGRNGVSDNDATSRWSAGAWYGWGYVGSAPSGLHPWDEFPLINGPAGDNPGDGAPRAVAFFEDRLWWAGTPGQPQTLWGSVSGEYENHAADDAITGALVFAINDQSVNAVDWLFARRGFVIGTRGGEFVADGQNPDEPVSAENPLKPERTTAYGSREGALPVQVGTSLLFVQRSGTEIREFTYDEQNSSEFKAPDVSLLADHLFKNVGGVAQLAWHAEPHAIVWAVTGDGRLRACVFDRTQDVVGWSQHELGGGFSGGGPQVLSVAVIPHPDGAQDQVWFLVRRDVGDAIEYLEVPFVVGDNLATDAWYVDSGQRYSGGPATVVHGLDHLEGLEVQVLADGIYAGVFTVASGSITLFAAASEVVVGLAYGGDAVLVTSRLEAGGADGTAQGKFKNVRNVVLRLHQTGVGLFYGRDPETMDRLPMRTDNDPSSPTAVSLFDGDTRELELPGDNDTLGRIRIEHREPLPCTIVSLVAQLQTEDD